MNIEAVISEKYMLKMYPRMNFFQNMFFASWNIWKYNKI